MSMPQSIKLSKPAGYFQQKLTLNTADFFITFTKLAINLFTSPWGVIGDAMDMTKAFNDAKTPEEQAYLWIYRSLHSTVSGFEKEHAARIKGVYNNKEDFSKIIADFEKAASELIVELDLSFPEQPHKLNLFKLFISHYCQYIEKYHPQAFDINDLVVKLQEAFKNELFNEFRKNRQKYRGIDDYFGNIMVPGFRGNNNHFFKEITPLPRTDIPFIGREFEIKLVTEELNSGPGRVLLHGMGGVGKTSILLEYLKHHKYKYDHIIWISVSDSDTENALALAILSDFTLLNNLDFSVDKNIPLIENAKMLLNSLQKIEGHNLIILDNIGYDSLEIIDSIPNSSWKILATSRIDLDGFQRVIVNTLPPDDIFALFRQYYSQTITFKTQVIQILEITGYHTLTIEIIAKILQNSNGRLSPNDVLTRLQESKLDESQLQIPVRLARLKPNTSFKEIQIHTYLLSLFEMSGLSEKEIIVLKDFSVFPPVPVEEYLLIAMLELDSNTSVDYLNTARKLAEQSWLASDFQNQTFSCHPMIQEVVRHQFKPVFDDHNWYIGHLMINLNHPNLSTRSKLIPYCRSAIRHFSQDFKEITFLKLGISKTLLELGKLSESSTELPDDKDHIVKKYPVMQATTLFQKAEIRQQMGDFDTALTYFKQALQIIDEVIISGDRLQFKSKLSILENIGSLYYQTGNLELAEPFFLDQLRFTQAYSEDFPDDVSREFYHARAEYSVGMLASKKTELQNAKRYLLQSLARLENLVTNSRAALTGKFAPLRLITVQELLGKNYSLLGSMLLDEGNFITASQFLLKDCDLAREMYEQNPLSESYRREYAVAYSKLGDLYLQQKQPAKALSIFEKVNQIMLDIHNANPESANNKFDLIGSYERLYKINETLQQNIPAFQAMDNALKYARQLHEEYPAVPAYLQKLLDLLFIVQSMVEKTGIFEKKVEIANHIYRIVANSDDNTLPDIQKKSILAHQAFVLANEYFNLPDYNNARDHFAYTINTIQEIIDVQEKAYQIAFRNVIAVSFLKYGLCIRESGELQKAFDYINHAAGLLTQLYKETGQEQFQQLLKTALNYLAETKDMINKKKK